MFVDADALRTVSSDKDYTHVLSERLENNPDVITREIGTVYNSRERRTHGWTIPATITFRGTEQPELALKIIENHYVEFLDAGHDLTPVVDIGREFIDEEDEACLAVELYDEPERKR